MADDARSVADGRKAFETTASFPWYDAQKDSLRPLRLPAAPQRSGPWEVDLGFLKPVAWAVLSVLLALLVLALVYAYRNRQPGVRDQRSATDRSPSRAVVEALGFLAERPQGDLLAEARRHYREGNYSEAIIYLFSYELVELDRFALVHLARGKTNRQYVREASRVPSLAQALEATMMAFEGVFFGGRTLDRAAFEACWQRLGEFERLAAREGT